MRVLVDLGHGEQCMKEICGGDLKDHSSNSQD